jgi:hypothetical protein
LIPIQLLQEASLPLPFFASNSSLQSLFLKQNGSSTRKSSPTAKMRYPSVSTFLLTASAVLILSAPVPLNINMGAYSPALVVGDGAIGFKDGATSVTNLMNTLQGAANTAAANGAAAPAAAAPAASQAPAATPAAAPAEGAAIQDQAATQLPQGMGKNVVTREAIDEDAYYLAALKAETERRDTADEIEGEGWEFEKRDETLTDEDLQVDEEADANLEERDLAGFNAALNYASGALKSGPEVQLGTGEGESGVGITQKQGGTTSAAAGNATKAE